MSAENLMFAAGAGVATFLSPCALPLVPGYVGYYVTRSEPTRRRAVGVAIRGVAAGAGALLTLAGLAGLAVAVGRPVARRLSLLEPAVGVALILVGATALTGWSPPRTPSLPGRRADTAGFALFGAGYAGASAGCVLPIFLAVVVQALALPVADAVAVLGAYAAGVAVPLFLTTLAVGAGLDLATGRLVCYGARLERVAGAVLVSAGLGQLAVATVPGAASTLA